MLSYAWAAAQDVVRQPRKASLEAERNRSRNRDPHRLLEPMMR
jgi:hypothetical protein